MKMTMESTDTHFTSRTLSVILCCTTKRERQREQIGEGGERGTVDWPLSDTNYVLSAIIREISAPSLQRDNNTRTGKELSSGVTLFSSLPFSAAPGCCSPSFCPLGIFA